MRGMESGGGGPISSMRLNWPAGLLGISASAWLTAKDTMGSETAAVTIAAILQRSENIRSPGGYLRSLVERKRAGGAVQPRAVAAGLVESKPIGLEPLSRPLERTCVSAPEYECREMVAGDAGRESNACSWRSAR